MLALTLNRTIKTDQITLGELSRDDTQQQIGVTLELPWNDNIPDKSCIPTGVYTCAPHSSVLHPNTYQITGVADRSEVLIHIGNFLRDTLGCVLLGAYTGADGLSIIHSTDAMNRLRSIVGQNTFVLTIQ